MAGSKLARLRQKVWRHHLPLLVKQNAGGGDPYNYYSVYFTDTEHHHFRLAGWNGHDALLERFNSENNKLDDKQQVNIESLAAMQEEILHHRRFGAVRFSHILAFSFSHYTGFLYLKTAIKRLKGQVMSQLFAKTELKSRDRMVLLNLLVNAYIQQRPSQYYAGISTDDVIARLYGELWYKHIRNEEFKRKITLLLQSLVISEDLTISNGRYFVTPQSINSIVEFEKDERRNQQQIKMQRNIVRLMIIITASTLMVTLALLSLAGIVDLQKIWHAILNIKPLRVLLKLI
ncbi:hypothetical protein F9C28_16705 [Shimwellia pseudoproteus]|uniref:hypothetical protein n=1 Tax=Shimwellia pseudoproteus TaxID=570012 RepID=UPI0018EB383E|nr:hypothetical protein [Shimwellia pseudoproteus]MBJ3816510.1 hypothetical protein [Shimwellia pseudoproteus]